MKKQFTVIGLGRFGGSVTKTLLSLGYEVMGSDSDERRVQKFAPILAWDYHCLSFTSNSIPSTQVPK